MRRKPSRSKNSKGGKTAYYARKKQDKDNIGRGKQIKFVAVACAARPNSNALPSIAEAVTGLKHFFTVLFWCRRPSDFSTSNLVITFIFASPVTKTNRKCDASHFRTMDFLSRGLTSIFSWEAQPHRSHADMFSWGECPGDLFVCPISFRFVCFLVYCFVSLTVKSMAKQPQYLIFAPTNGHSQTDTTQWTPYNGHH